MPELPRPTQRWTVRRKASVIEAVRGGWVPIDEICELYSVSVDEFLAWERDIDRYGIHGLRTTRYQIYRDTDVQRDRPGNQPLHRFVNIWNSAGLQPSGIISPCRGN